MNFYQAAKSMTNGIAVQSLVSKTVYEMTREGLLAEGILVPFSYLTIKEANGEWEEVEIIDAMKEYHALTVEQKSKILDEALEHHHFNKKYDKKLS